MSTIPFWILFLSICARSLVVSTESDSADPWECPSFGAFDFRNATWEDVPPCFCDSLNASISNDSKIECLYRSTLYNLSRAIDASRRAGKSIQEIYISNMVFTEEGIPDNFFQRQRVEPKILKIVNCFGNDRRLTFGNDSLNGTENSLQEIEIFNCMLFRVPNAFARLTALRTLKLTETVVYKLYEGDFENLHNLRYLDLSANSMYNAEAGAFDPLRNLETLILGPENGFNLTVLPELNKLANLTKLDLSGNAFHTLPNFAFRSLNKLRDLNLAKNSIDFLRADAFRGLPELRRLDVSVNVINYTEYNTFNFELKNLRYLSLFSNNIAALEPETFVNLPNLATLDFSWNELYDIPAYAFEPLTKLQYLNLSGNLNLYDFNDRSFVGLTSLKALNLSHTYANSTGAIASANLSRLHTLDVSRTQLAALDANLFSAGNLKNLYAHDARLSTVGADVVGVERLRLVDVSGNHFRCDDDLRWFISWLTITANRSQSEFDVDVESESDGNNASARIRNVTGAACWMPLELRGVPLVDVDVRTMRAYRQQTWAPPTPADANDTSSLFGMTLFPEWRQQAPSTKSVKETPRQNIAGSSNADKRSVDGSAVSSNEKVKIVVIVVASLGIVGTILVAGFVVFVLKRRRQKRKRTESTEMTDVAGTHFDVKTNSSKPNETNRSDRENKRESSIESFREIDLRE